jgi:prevent-host-death family protein
LAIDAMFKKRHDVHMDVNTAKLRNNLSFYLREVRKGHRVVVMDRGCPIAQLVPIDETQGDLWARIDELGKEGVVTVPLSRQRADVTPIAMHRPQTRASRLVSQLRDDP